MSTAEYFVLAVVAAISIVAIVISYRSLKLHYIYGSIFYEMVNRIVNLEKIAGLKHFNCNVCGIPVPYGLNHIDKVEPLMQKCSFCLKIKAE